MVGLIQWVMREKNTCNKMSYAPIQEISTSIPITKKEYIFAMYNEHFFAQISEGKIRVYVIHG